MRPNQITTDHAFRDYGNQTRFVDASGSSLASGKQAASMKTDAGTGVSVSTTPASFGKLQAVNAHLNSVAKSIRVADSVMQRIGGFLDEMEKGLESVAKSYPPFPPGSEERVKYLEGYTGLRAQIDQLTMPPRDEGARRILSDPQRTGEPGDWEVPGADGGVQGTVRAQQVHPGPDGLDIPALPKDAGDEEILGALEKLGKAKETLEIKRSKLAEDVENLKRQSAFKITWKKMHPSYGEEMKAAEEEEFFADRTSADVKYSLSRQYGLTLTETQTTLAQFLS
jgi:hypothetical protein